MDHLESGAQTGSPPRAWGRRRSYAVVSDCQSGSPPRAWGRRADHRSECCTVPVHPHVRGDGATRIPRDNGRPRFTPTCVGTATSNGDRAQISPPVHPHVRGDGAEYRSTSSWPHRFTPTCVGTASRMLGGAAWPGSPPRAWGRRAFLDLHWRQLSVHPHVRGDGSLRRHRYAWLSGSPPRAWGRLNVSASLPGPSSSGSPPRAWGRRDPATHRCGGARFTPTCVGTAAHGQT